MRVQQQKKHLHWIEKKGSLLSNTLVGLIIILIISLLSYGFVSQQRNSAFLAESNYVNEVVKAIELSEIGDEITIDVSKGTDIADKNGMDLKETFLVNNSNQEVCVKFSSGRKSCLSYVNSVDLKDFSVRVYPPKNTLYFKVVDKGGANE